jgi:thiosulfate/3-mercaptopyruvate sulfurtransferase
MPLEAIGPTVTTAWLAENIGRSDLKIFDGSHYLPAENRNAKDEFDVAHIPGAQFFDIDAVSDHGSNLPHMFPDQAGFDAAVGAMGVGNDDTVITYDGGKWTGACRVWWMFRAFGHRKLAVLDGGFAKWTAEGKRVESGPAATVASKNYRSSFNPEATRDFDHMMSLASGGAAEQIVDARSAARFDGTAPEPREGMRSGHMPGAFSLPYDRLLNADCTLKSGDELESLFVDAGVNLDRPIVTSCGSGVSAAVLLLGLDLLGRERISLYDGSWAEWGSRQDTPIVT